MAARMFSRGVTSLIILSAVASPSFAGGLERGGYNIDQLFVLKITPEQFATAMNATIEA